MYSANKKRAFWILMILFATWILGYAGKTAINIAAIDIRKEFGLDTGSMGLVMSSFSLGYAIMTLFGGVLADRYGSRWVITIMAILWSIFTITTGMAWSLTALIFMRFAYGFSEGGFPSGTSVTIAELFPTEQRGRAKSFIISAATLGLAIGSIAVAALTKYVGWRSSFYIIGGLGIILALLFWAAYGGIKTDDNQTKAAAKKASMLDALKIPLAWKLAAIQFSIGVFLWGLNSWLPTYWVEVRKLDMTHMGALSAIPWIASFFVMNLGGWVLDKYMAGRESWLLFCCLLISAFFMYMMFNTDSVALGFLYLTLSTVAASVASPTIFVFPLKYIPREYIGATTGVANFGQQFAGILAPTLMGYMITMFHGSYDAVFWLVIVVILIGALISLTLKPTKASAPGQAPSAT